LFREGDSRHERDRDERQEAEASHGANCIGDLGRSTDPAAP